MSSVGKGITAASIGALLKARGFRVTALKIDPYVNVDAGTMNPTEHGEGFVTVDGDETDQDMGNYERFLDTTLTSINYMTTGRVYQSVINRERGMGYKGRCVQVVPDIPKEVLGRIEQAVTANKAEIAIIEIGGTVGEYENILFLEAARMLKLERPSDVAFVLVSYLPIPSHVGEMKTKPTQHAARSLNSAGIQADVIIARGERMLDAPRREKLAVHCGVPKNAAIAAPDVSSIYDVPGLFDKQDLAKELMAKLGLKPRKNDMRVWNNLSTRVKNARREIRIAVVGKYFGTGDFTLADSYISVIESLKHAAWAAGAKPALAWIDAEQFEKKPRAIEMLKKFDGILVPGGFGSRGIEGIISTIKFAREKKIPYFGLCYGMQLACIELARSIGLRGASSVEIDEKTKYPIIIVNPFQQQNIKEGRYGATMRLGSYSCQVMRGTKAFQAYKEEVVHERHRHRYEFNNEYRTKLEKAGMVFSGINPESGLVEIVELKNHPWFVGVQFHPEFTSRPLRPQPLFLAFIKAALKHK